MIRVVGIDHLVLRVRDIEASIAFYRGALGCVVERRRDELGLVHLRAGHSLIDLVSLEGKLGRQGGAAAGNQGRNVDHFCLRIESFDTGSIIDHLQSAGLEPSEVHMNFGADGDGPAIYIEDPDGNSVEIKGPPVLIGQ